MEYVFGTVRRNGVDYENVKTVGVQHSELTGFCSVKRQYTDNIIEDDFKVVEKYRSKEEGGVCYDWYIIDDHNRTIDKFTPAKAAIEVGIANSQDAVCELSEELDERITEIEDALCDLSKE